ncbi:MAG: TNT domain-containing protein [Nocardioides sp.]|uniref:TNT domain-containing protein n=1 Tax=Nocardioides sp. TaxID=35761 RepID=UPI003F020DC9
MTGNIARMQTWDRGSTRTYATGNGYGVPADELLARVRTDGVPALVALPEIEREAVEKVWVTARVGAQTVEVRAVRPPGPGTAGEVHFTGQDGRTGTATFEEVSSVTEHVLVALDAARRSASPWSRAGGLPWTSLNRTPDPLPALLDGPGVRTVRTTATWSGGTVDVTRCEDAASVTVVTGDAGLAKRGRMGGDPRDGFFAVVALDELADVVETVSVVLGTPADERVRAARLRLDAAKAADPTITGFVEVVDSLEKAHDGPWVVLLDVERCVVGATARGGAFRPYEEVATPEEAVDLAVRLAATPLGGLRAREVTPQEDADGSATGSRIVAGVRARGGGLAPATVRAGDLLDLLGEETSHHLYAAGTRMQFRSQPPTDVAAPYRVLRVVGPLPETVHDGVAAPWFGQPGGGAVVVLDRPVRWYVDAGLLEVVPGPPPSGAALSAMHLVRGLLRFPGHRGVTYRGMPDDAGFTREGQIVTAQGLLPTSRDPRVATENFTSKGLYVVVGRSGRAIEEVSVAAHEREVVFLPGTVFRIAKVARIDRLPVAIIEDLRPDGTAYEPLGSYEEVAAHAVRAVDAARQRQPLSVTQPGKYCGDVG